MFGFFLFQIVGCSSQPVKPGSGVQRFSTQAYYLDKRNNKGQQMTLEVVARKNQRIRMDAKVVLGLHVATAVMTNDQVQVAVHAEKKYYEGNANPQTLQKTIGIPLYPLIFHAMLYRQAFKGAGWACQVSQGKVQICQQKPSGMQIRWEEQEEATMVTANSKTFELQWKILPPETVEEKSNYFEVKVPDSYSRMNL